MEQRCKVAVVQRASYLFDTARTMDDCIATIETISKQQANIILFPEAYIGGYPRGLDFQTAVGFRRAEGRDDFYRYAQGAIVVPSEETMRLGEVAKQANAYVIIGVIEKDALYHGATLYCTALIFGPDGTLLAKHRKLKPTGSERLIWGEGDGSTLPVIDTPFGRIGVLICWENYMPLARAAMYAKGVDLYLAPTADSRDTWFATVRHIGLEGRCFVLSSNQYVTSAHYPEDIAAREDVALLGDELCRGGSCIVDPLGQFVAEPVFGEETVLYAELDLTLLTKARFDFHAVGHYARNDVFTLHVNEQPRQSVTFE